MIVELRNELKSSIKRELSAYADRSKVDSLLASKSVLILRGETTKYFLIPKQLEDIFNEIPFKQGLFYSGLFIGELIRKVFFPSLAVLDFLSKNAEKKFVKVDYKRSVLFSCGRDIPSMGITAVSKDIRKNDLVLVLNENNEGIGYGRIMEQAIVIQELKAKPVIKNINDIGDFIRREQGIKREQ